MSELSPLEIANRAKNAEVSIPIDRFKNAEQAFRGKTRTIKPDTVSDRYPMRKWVVTEVLTGLDSGMHDLSYESTVQLGYPIKGRKHPNEIHIIIDGNFAEPWATIDESNKWQQLIGTSYSDTTLSDENQMLADGVVDIYNRRILSNKLHNRRVIQRVVGTTAVVGVLAAGIYVGLKFYNNKQEEDAARALAEQQRIEAFDKEWSTRDLTGSPIAADVFGTATKKQLPTDIPTIALDRVSDSNYKYKFREPLSNNQVRLINLIEDGCYVIETGVEEDTTISAATNETTNSVVVALVDDENVLKICKNGLYSLSKPTDIAIQIHQK